MDEFLIPALEISSEAIDHDDQNLDSQTSIETGPLLWDGEWDRSDSI